MKKLFSVLSIIVLLLAGYESKAQASTTTVNSFPVIAGDSLVTADTVFKRFGLASGYTTMGVQLALKKATGTLDGKMYMLTSINGVNYVLTDSASLTAVPNNAFISNGGYTHTAIIQKVAPPGSKYIVYVTQAGSLTASATKWDYTVRKN